MLQWIFFDIGSTLIDEQAAYEHRARDAVADSDVAYDTFYQTMLAFYRQGKKGDLEAAKKYGLPITPWHNEDECLYPDAVACLEALKSRYRLGIIANQTPGLIMRLKSYGIDRYFDLIVSSAEEGVAKPDPAIFRLALKRAGCRPKEAAMVGDRLDNDIAPANLVGMKSVWIRQGFGQYQKPGTADEIPDIIVSTLTELSHIL